MVKKINDDKNISYLYLILAAIAFVILLLTLYPYKPDISKLSALPTPTPTSSRWQNYRNDQYGFEFQYPNNWYLLEDNNFGLFISNKPFSSVSTEIVPQEGQVFVKIYYFHSAFENGLGIMENEKGIISDTKLINTNNTIGIKQEYIKKDTTIQKEKIASDQIISTFKFLPITSISPTNTVSKYTCPSVEWVDCMPGPGPLKTQCQPDYLNWAKINCPNFKGAAY